MSISSVLSPAALASQVLGHSPLGAAACGAGSFISTLLQTLQQAGTVTPSSGAAGTSGTTAAAALQARGQHHGHHGGSLVQLEQLLQQTRAGASGISAAASG